MRILEFIQEYSGALTFIITVVYVLFTICIFKANKAAVDASTAQVEEMRKEFELNNRAIIEIELLQLNRCFFVLRFINHGKFNANDVKITFSNEFIESIKEEEFKICLQNQNYKKAIIGIGEHYDIFIGSNKYRENSDKKPATGTISYTSNGKIFNEKFFIDLENYATFYTVDTYNDKIIEELKTLNSNLTAISNKLK